MTLEGEVNLLDPFTHTKQNHEKIMNFDFVRENSTTEREKVRIDETFCTLVGVGGKFLEKKTFKKVMKKIDEIRKIIRIDKDCRFYPLFFYFDSLISLQT